METGVRRAQNLEQVKACANNSAKVTKINKNLYNFINK